MSTNHTEKEMQSLLQGATRDSANAASEDTKIPMEDAQPLEAVKKGKSTNYFQSLIVEEPDLVEEPEPVEEPDPEPEPIEALKPATPISKAKKRRIRRAREAEREAESGEAKSAAAPSTTDEADQPADAESAATQTEHLSRKPTAPGAHDDSDDDISELNLDDSDQDSPADGKDAPPSTTAPLLEADDDADADILTQAVQQNKAAIVQAQELAESSTHGDDIALFAGYACLILACFAQYGLGDISVAQILLLAGTVGVCVPLEWFTELAGVGEAERRGWAGRT